MSSKYFPAIEASFFPMFDVGKAVFADLIRDHGEICGDVPDCGEFLMISRIKSRTGFEENSLS